MRPCEVIRLIVEAQRMVQKNEQAFDRTIKTLAKELQGICDGEIDLDALIHSFL